jgi:membrane protein
MLQFLRLLRISFIKAFEHDQFAVAKAAAYSAIFTLFPAALLLASILVASQSTEVFIREISYAIGRIMPRAPDPRSWPIS